MRGGQQRERERGGKEEGETKRETERNKERKRETERGGRERQRETERERDRGQRSDLRMFSIRVNVITFKHMVTHSKTHSNTHTHSHIHTQLSHANTAIYRSHPVQAEYSTVQTTTSLKNTIFDFTRPVVTYSNTTLKIEP